MTYRNMTYTSRWELNESYSTDWEQRSLELLKMFLTYEADIEGGGKYSLCEYGCGPNAPFEKILKDESNIRVKKFDIKQWDKSTVIINLNNSNLTFQQSDIATFSGVLEYLYDVKTVLKKCISVNKYLLLSYAFFPIQAKQDDQKYLSELHNRVVKNGWINHYTNIDFVNMLSSVGIVSAVGIWKGQSLYILRSRECES